MMDLNRFAKLPLMGILRDIKADEIEPMVETLVKSGLKTVEITMNTAGAPALIEKMATSSNGRLMVGAGTVISLEDIDSALGAGAEFIVMPTLAKDVVERCAALDVPVFPGALTPQEIENAWRAGATMVKVFPTSMFGPSYFKELSGPFPQIPLLACGGVNRGNINEFFENGAKAASFGARVFKRDWIERGAFDLIGNSIGALVDAYNSWFLSRKFVS